MDSKSIRITILFTIGIAIALITYLAVNLQQRSEHEILTRFNEHQLLLARTIAGQVSQFIETRARGLDALSSYAASKSSSPAVLKEYLDEYASRLASYHVESLTRYDRKRKVLYSTSARLRNVNCTTCDFLEWAERPENEGKVRLLPLSEIPEWSVPTADTASALENTHQFRVLFVTPITRTISDGKGRKLRSEYLGALSLTLHLHRLFQEGLVLANAESGQNDLALLTESGELLVQSSHLDGVRRNFLQADESCFTCHATFAHDSLMLSQKAGNIEYQLLDRQKKVAGFAEIKYANASWILVVSTTRDEISGFISKSLLDTFSLLGLVLVVFAGISVLTYKYYNEKLRAEEERNQWQQKRELEERIRQSEERYRRLVEFSPEAMAVHSGGKLVYVNSAAIRLMGASKAEELLGKPILEVVHPEYRAMVAERVRKVTTGGGELPLVEEKFIRLDGTVIDVEVVAIPMMFEGKPAVQVMVRDISGRKRSEKALKDQRDNFEALLNIQSEMGIAFAVLDAEERKVLFVNEAASTLTGHSREELLSMNLFEHVPPEDRPELMSRLSRRLGGEALPEHFEVALLHKDGHRVYAEVALKIRPSDGRTIFHVIARDITNRRKTEEALRQSEERYRAFVKQSTEGIWRYELERPLPISTPEEEQVSHLLKYGFLAECNDAMAHMYGFKRAEDIVGKRMSDFMLPSDPGNLGFLRAFVRSGYRLTDAETREVDTKGQEKYFLNNFVGILQDGYLVRAWGSQRDVTERKRAQSLISESEQKYRTLFEESKDVVFISTPEGRFVDINQAGVELFGYASKEELLQADIGKDLYVKSTERDRALQLLNEKGYLKDFESIARRKDGRKIIVLETTIVVRDKEGKIQTLRGILRDVTAQRQLEEELQQAQKIESIATLAGGVAHDFNNILGIILGYISAIEQDDVDVGKRGRNIEAIKKAVERGAGLVRQMLTFARKSEPIFASVDAVDCIKELTVLLQHAFPPAIKIVTRFNSTESTISGDLSQLSQAFLNLCLNARDAILANPQDADEHGTLTISSKNLPGKKLRDRFGKADAETYLMLSFSDTGVGMAEDVRNRIFEPFFTTKELGKGTGLGLSVVYGVVNSHHGFIEVESSPRKGTTFLIYLPIKAATAEVQKEIVERHAQPAQNTVLLVEDEVMLLDLLAALLEENGYRVLTAHDGLQAVEVYKKYQKEIGLVLSDMGLPKLGGWDALKQMREINPEVKVILASGYFDPQLKGDMIQSGAKDFVQKPYVPEQILQRIREVIAGE